MGEVMVKYMTHCKVNNSKNLKMMKTSWGWAGPSSDQTVTETWVLLDLRFVSLSWWTKILLATLTATIKYPPLSISSQNMVISMTTYLLAYLLPCMLACLLTFLKYTSLYRRPNCPVMTVNHNCPKLESSHALRLYGTWFCLVSMKHLSGQDMMEIAS